MDPAKGVALLEIVSFIDPMFLLSLLHFKYKGVEPCALRIQLYIADIDINPEELGKYKEGHHYYTLPFFLLSLLIATLLSVGHLLRAVCD